MTTPTTLSRTVAAAFLAAALSACSTTPTVPTLKLTDLLAQGTQAAASGEKEKAVTTWRQAAVAYPADKSPWSNIAQTRYEAGQYGEAISAAQEVLIRDPNDKLANSIIATSGLRLATRALGDLSRQNNLSGSLRTESQDLAKLLRETLGETVLFNNSPPRTPVQEKVKVATVKKTGKTPSADDKTASPFDVLK